jgi:hypothetical protein
VAHLCVDLDPPVRSDQRTEPIKAVVLGPHFVGTSVWPDPLLPVAVYVYVPRVGVARKPDFDGGDFDLMAWAELYRTEAEANEASRLAR